MSAWMPYLIVLAEPEAVRATERELRAMAELPEELTPANLADDEGARPNPILLEWQVADARSRRERVLFVQRFHLPGGGACLAANDAAGGRYWLPLEKNGRSPGAVARALERLQIFVGSPLAVFPHGEVTGLCRQLPELAHMRFCLHGYAPRLDPPAQRAPDAATRLRTPHLKRLEAESIHIMREAVAEAGNPAMLYSSGKDSSVMLHLARKAFFPSPPPFPLLHIDTRWEFQEMYLFRDYMAKQSAMELRVHVNPEAIARDINPFDHGASVHTDITRTEGLKQALDKYRFDAVFCGTRGDEETSRANQRIFSLCTGTDQSVPNLQRPELWNLYNARKGTGESLRVFPLAHWTELDVWQYIFQESIPVVPLYFARPRPVLMREGMLLLVDDARMRIAPGEQIEQRSVRFRTLGCYPLTGAIESSAATLPEIILEVAGARRPESEGRAIDADPAASPGKKKMGGYF